MSEKNKKSDKLPVDSKKTDSEVNKKPKKFSKKEDVYEIAKAIGVNKVIISKLITNKKLKESETIENFIEILNKEF